jgi:integrase
MRRTKKMLNFSVSLNQFAPILKDFTPQDLEIDQLYGDFLSRLEAHLRDSDLEQSTMTSYVGTLCQKILPYANVKPAVTTELKEQIAQIRKSLKQPRPAHKSIQDEEIVNWIGRLDHFCNDPEDAPNLCVVANPRSNLKSSAGTSIRLLLAVRCYVWLCLITGGRADEVRRIRIEEVNEQWVRRELLKARLYADSADNNVPEWAWQRIGPYLEYVAEHHSSSELLFSENDNAIGRGTISPKTLRELAKGSMIEAGLGPTSPSGCYYRTHDLRKTLARWIDQNGGSIQEISAFLTHSSPDVTFKHYFAHDHKQALSDAAQSKAMDRLGELLQERESLDAEIEEIRGLFRDLDYFEVFDDGGLAMPEGTAYGGPGFVEYDMEGGEPGEVRAPGLEPGTS